jgi:hypothetical protein
VEHYRQNRIKLVAQCRLGGKLLAGTARPGQQNQTLTKIGTAPKRANGSRNKQKDERRLGPNLAWESWPATKLGGKSKMQARCTDPSAGSAWASAGTDTVAANQRGTEDPTGKLHAEEKGLRPTAAKQDWERKTAAEEICSARKSSASLDRNRKSRRKTNPDETNCCK